MPPLTSARLRAVLSPHADPKRAVQMQAYMKSALPYFGVPLAQVRALSKKLFADAAFESSAAWAKTMRTLWYGAERREERYAALELARHKVSKPFRKLAALPLYEELIVDGAWWDVVDELATHLVGELLLAHPAEVKKAMRTWSRSKDLWKRRSAIIAQVGHRDGTDMKLLFDVIEPAIHEKEFFLRKAIGWALRAAARYEPDEVRRYVKDNEARLSGLSKREALRH